MENRDRLHAPADTLSEEEKEELRQALKSIQPQTEMGRRLIELSLVGVEQGVPRWDIDEIMKYLGRDPQSGQPAYSSRGGAAKRQRPYER